MNYNTCIDYINNYISNSNKNQIIIAIDGKSASGKTTFSKELEKIYDCNIFHTDDYFLRPEQRTEERYKTPGGNFDKERFKEEIINGLISKHDFVYKPFDCKTMKLKNEIKIKQKRINIIEGAYSTHPYFADIYDLRIFFDISKELQIKRITNRNKDMALTFFNRWIPLEEIYFEEFKIKDNASYIHKAE